MVASLIEQRTRLAEGFINLGQAGANLFGLGFESGVACFACGAFAFERDQLFGELLVFFLALKFLGGGAFDLRAQRGDAFAHFANQSLDTLQDASGSAVTFFERGDASEMLGGAFGGGIAGDALRGQLFVSAGGSLLQLDALSVERTDFRMARGDQVLLL